jgi:hypothetical protein
LAIINLITSAKRIFADSVSLYKPIKILCDKTNLDYIPAKLNTCAIARTGSLNKPLTSGAAAMSISEPLTGLDSPLHVTNNITPNKKRIWLVAAGHAVVWAGSYIALNKAWYADYPKEDFHFFNDWEEWNQMDKAGHVWTAYQLSRFSTEAWRWTGLKKSTSVWIGSASAVAYQSIIEIQDGFSSEWGFSWGDMTANIVGAAAFAAQELTWGDQRIQVKMSYWPYEYPDDLIDRRNQLFGTGQPRTNIKGL